MNETEYSFAVGFVKSAMDRGYTEDQAVTIYKQADEDEKSNWLGRYLNLKSQRSNAVLEHPWKSTATMPIGGGYVDALPLMAGTGFNKDKRRSELERQDQEESGRDYSQSAGRGAAALAPVTATAGGLYGAGIGHLAAHGGSAKERLLTTLLGALGGAGIGGAFGGIAGATAGLANKAINKHTAPEAHESARNKLTEHPFLHSLPGADVISAFSQHRSSKQPQEPPVNQ